MIPEVHITDNHVQELLNRLAEAEETLRAIRHGEIDGLVVDTPHGERVFTLKGAEQPYRVMVEAMQEGAATLGTDGTILYCNRRFAAMLHTPHENVLGASVTTFLAPDSQAEFARLLTGCRRESMRGEVDLLAQDGTRVPVSLACSALPNSEIESICLVATDLTARMEAEAAIQQLNQQLEARVEARTAELARANEALRNEIAERKRAEEAHREIAERFRIAIEGSPITLMETDRDLRYTWVCNPATGFSAAQLLGKTDREWHAPEEAEKLMAIKRRAMETGSVQREVVTVVVAGQPLHYDLYIEPKQDASGQITGIIGYAADMTARQRAEQEREQLLSEMERRAAELDSVINSSTDAILLYDTDNNVILMNPAAEALYCMTLKDFQASSCAERRNLFRLETLDGHPYPPEMAPNILALRGEVVRGALAVMHCPDGRTVWTTASAGPVRTADGRIVGAVASITDVSKLHEMQEQQRTLLHLVSHDLRIPLAIVNGHTDLLQERLSGKVDGTPITDSLAAIGRGIRRMNTMIEDLTDLARLEGKQFQLNREPLALAPCLANLLSQAAAVLDVSRVCLDLPADLPLVLADGDRLHRIVTNLLSNALKYSDAGTPVLVRATRQENAVVVSVSDVGRGIAATDLPHLFERFYRSQGERRAEGIGLGLYIARLLVEAHDGRIWADSTPDHGSTFSFSLPIA